MNTSNSFSKAKKLLGFTVILLVTTGTAGYLLYTLFRQDKVIESKPVYAKQPDRSPENADFISANNAVFSLHLAALNNLDEKFVSLLTTTNDKKALADANQMIYVQEEAFRGSIDSFFLNTPGQADAATDKLFNAMVGDYRSILENRRLIGSLRSALNLSNSNLKPDDMALLKMQTELQQKNNEIASLQNKIQELSVKPKPEEPIVTSKPEEPAPAPANKDAIAKLENKLNAMTILYSSMKQDNDKLQKQNAELNAGADVVAKSKLTGYQQRIDALNAELRLAQVDCNLSRVDAAKIIYTARQRKELLSEASGILSVLANSEDAAVRKKVQDKITKLNQVAASSRD